MFKLSKLFFYASWLLSGGMMALSTGCASGGFSLTRKYAQFVNGQQIILRVILYILTAVVFAVTMLIDMVVFNTMDFWNGRVSAGSYQFQGGDKTFYVEHAISPENLKSSTIKVVDADKKLLQTVAFVETATHEVELLVDGKLRAKGQDISSLPKVSLYDQHGNFTEQKTLSFENVAVR